MTTTDNVQNKMLGYSILFEDASCNNVRFNLWKTMHVTVKNTKQKSFHVLTIDHRQSDALVTKLLHSFPDKEPDNPVVTF